MTDLEIRAFLADGTRTAKLATVSADGAPRVVPVWFVLDEGEAGIGTIVFTTGRTSAKAAAMRRDPRVALCVDAEAPPYDFVEVIGRVTMVDDVEAMLPWATRIGGRYMGADRAEEFGRRNAVPEEVLVRLTPERVIAVAGMTD
jgi:PPOX class probable F420-dependent enzyme